MQSQTGYIWAANYVTYAFELNMLKESVLRKQSSPLLPVKILLISSYTAYS